MRMANRELVLSTRWMQVIAILSCGLLVSASCAQSASPSSTPATAAVQAGAQSRYHASRFPKRAGEYYRFIWGIDSLSVKAVESGELIRFTYHVLDPDKAQPLNDKKVEAFLIAPGRQVQLVVPSLEKVGQLRQTNTPEPGRFYWMAFSNPHRVVRRGDRVNVVIGQFHVDGLLVD
jgi:hypothetical protein